jgi:hypothetical protein
LKAPLYLFLFFAYRFRAKPVPIPSSRGHGLAHDGHASRAHFIGVAAPRQDTL